MTDHKGTGDIIRNINIILAIPEVSKLCNPPPGGRIFVLSGVGAS